MDDNSIADHHDATEAVSAESHERLEQLQAWAMRQQHGVERVEAEQASAEALVSSAADEIESLRQEFESLIAARANVDA